MSTGPDELNRWSDEQVIQLYLERQRDLVRASAVRRQATAELNAAQDQMSRILHYVEERGLAHELPGPDEL